MKISVQECLMAKLLEALNDDTQLILLGDQNQLAAVEDGRCFGDICDALSTQSITTHQQSFSLLPPEQKSRKRIVELVKSYRFPDESIIGRVSRLINSGGKAAVEEAFSLVGDETPTEGEKQSLSITWHESLDKPQLLKELLPVVAPYYKAVIEKETAVEALEAMDKIRILTCIKNGDFGSIAINTKVEAMLVEKKLIEKDDIFYENRPIMILQNDYSLHLFNGDIGIVRSDENSNRRVYFPGKSEGTTRSFLPSRLPDHQTVYAMTIHKSQGSEFSHVAIVLPPEKNPVLSRELLYTAITRTKGIVDIYGTENIFKKMINKKTVINSGLQAKLNENLKERVIFEELLKNL